MKTFKYILNLSSKKFKVYALALFSSKGTDDLRTVSHRIRKKGACRYIKVKKFTFRHINVPAYWYVGKFQQSYELLTWNRLWVILVYKKFVPWNSESNKLSFIIIFFVSILLLYIKKKLLYHEKCAGWNSSTEICDPLSCLTSNRILIIH